MRLIRIVAAVAGLGTVAGVSNCTAHPTSAGDETAASILASSSPAAQATVRESPDAIELRFDPPARLRELTISGPEGTMPMMVHAVGEEQDYSIPLSTLGAGSYEVAWKATVAEAEYSGTFRFTIID